MIVDNVIYVDGRRTEESGSLQETYEGVRQRRGVAWIALYKPTEEEFGSVAREFGLHPLAVEDPIKAPLRTKLEHYEGTLFLVLKAARYLDETETVEFGEVDIFVGEDFVVMVLRGEPAALAPMRERLEGEPELLRRGPGAILYAIVDRVVDGYAPVVAGLENDIDEIETEVFSGNAGVSRRIYELSREVIEFQRATEPLPAILDRLISGGEAPEVDAELQKYLHIVQDRALRITERVEGFRQLLQNILSVNLTGASIAQNDQVKKISAWAAILFAPTLIGTVYGMNFDYMPELHWTFGYPFAMVLMLMVSVTLYLVFKRRGWL
ncbi:MAG TPA: magnesium/cobalt transporter CorA [Rubrobacter sp.]|jgi:magnesium transporter|nr:magnesium/cobalt transporter CorA [Rubrobacter sp.]